MSLLYEVSNLRKFYGRHPALALDSFQLRQGEAVAIGGPNGSGKSTLLRILAFLEAPSSGRLDFYAGGDFPRRRVTLLLQEPYLLKESVFYNVTLGLRLRGETGDLRGAFARAMAAAGFERPEAYARRRPYQLSGGEKQRVALAARIILATPVLLLDEPTSNMDAASARIITAVLRRLTASGVSIVCASHDPDLPEALSARKLVLRPAAEL